MGERMEGEEKWEGTCCDVMSGTNEREERRKEEKKRGMGGLCVNQGRMGRKTMKG
jgi:hypothetical protein